MDGVEHPEAHEPDPVHHIGVVVVVEDADIVLPAKVQKGVLVPVEHQQPLRVHLLGHGAQDVLLHQQIHLPAGGEITPVEVENHLFQAAFIKAGHHQPDGRPGGFMQPEPGDPAQLFDALFQGV